MSKRRDQKIKLLANALNGAAGSSLTVGVVGPLVAVFINLGDAATKVSVTALAVNALILAFRSDRPTSRGREDPGSAGRMGELLRPDFLFGSVILPVSLMIGGWVVLKLHNRWLDRELERERAEKHGHP